MKRYFPLGSLLTALALAVLFATVPGCPTKTPPKTEGEVAKTGDDKTGKSGAGEKKKGDPLVVKNTDAVVKGRVVYDGEPPTPAKIKMEGNADAPLCHAGPDHDPTWIVSKDKGVSGVVVSLVPPDGKFFALDKEQAEKYKGKPSIDQEYCLYEPHIVAMFAGYKTEDGKLHDTDEELLVKNSGKISHNTKVSGDPRKNGTIDKNVNGGEVKPYPIKYQADPVDISCTKHTWMSAKLVTFDHPFFAVTDKDGNFEIKNVPSGVEFTIKTWHEQSSPVTEKKSFSKGDNDVPTLKIKASS